MAAIKGKIELVGAKRARLALQLQERKLRWVPDDGARAWGDYAKNVMRGLAPRDTGALERAIDVLEVGRIPGGGASVWVGPGDQPRNSRGRPYPPHVEYGTRKMRARPFARPTVPVAAKAGPRIVTAAVRKALR
jgi:hypothetical protein